MNQEKRTPPAELELLLNSSLVPIIQPASIPPLLNSLSFRHVRKGERFITQGEDGDRFYIIQSGSCIINVQKDGKFNRVARLKSGDIVGEMAIVTGEHRSSHVDAETDMDLWSLTRQQFDSLSREFPDLRNFLTEIVAQRFSSSKITADRTIGKYTIHEVLDQGAWSIVYKGKHDILDYPVAIKMLKHHIAMDPEFSEKFRHEAKTIARLNHPNIVRVYDIEECYRTAFIIMEFLEGVSLKDLLRKKPNPPLSVSLDIILQVCSGLAYAHKQDIIHQDIKPANIFVQPDGQAKIVDFGLACSHGTIDFDMPGTPFYMSPEQIQGEPVDERTDIYALGIMVHELVTGKRPFSEESVGKLLALHLNEDTPDPRSLVPDLPEELCTVIMKSVRKNPADRFKNVSEVVDELSLLAEKLGHRYQSIPRAGEKNDGVISLLI